MYIVAWNIFHIIHTYILNVHLGQALHTDKSDTELTASAQRVMNDR